MTTRRGFIRTSAVTGGAVAMGINPVTGLAASHMREERHTRSVGKADEPKRILILGGTGFTGPFQVKYAVERGHKVTIFNRGRRQADIPASVEQLLGDRNND